LLQLSARVPGRADFDAGESCEGVLSAMRTSPQDPAQSDEARRKRIDKARRMSLAARAWEREHGPVEDPTVYDRDILPRIQAMSVRRLVALTGLSEYYVWKVRNGDGRLHARFWDRIIAAASKT
jgi:hypothetical protein